MSLSASTGGQPISRPVSCLAEEPACGDIDESGCGELARSGCGEATTSEKLFGTITPQCLAVFADGCSEGAESLKSSGVQVNANIAQFYMGVVDGGRDQSWKYSGHGDYLMNINGGKLFGAEGLLVTLRAEHRFGQSMTRPSGSVLPPNIAADLPISDSDQLYLTNVRFTQMFSETFGVFAGKTDSLNGNQNQFASGRGITQFSNFALSSTPLGFRTVPYSTLAAGFVILQDRQPVFTFSVLNATDTTNTVGISKLFNDGVVLAPELRLPTEFFGLPGHQSFSGTWSSRNYISLDQDPRVVFPNVPIARQSDSWSLSYNFDQYLFTDNGTPDNGWGVFGRAGLADPRTNPFAWFASAGLGGNSMIANRSADTWGAGYYYTGISPELDPLISAAIGGVRDTHGTEVFYNIAVTKWFHLTADAQYLVSARETIDPSLLVGARGVVSF